MTDTPGSADQGEGENIIPALLALRAAVTQEIPRGDDPEHTGNRRAEYWIGHSADLDVRFDAWCHFHAAMARRGAAIAMADSGWPEAQVAAMRSAALRDYQTAALRAIAAHDEALATTVQEHIVMAATLDREEHPVHEGVTVSESASRTVAVAAVVLGEPWAGLIADLEENARREHQLDTAAKVGRYDDLSSAQDAENNQIMARREAAMDPGEWTRPPRRDLHAL